MPAAVADKKGEYFERTIYSTFSGGKQLAGFQVKRDFIGAGRNLWDKRDYVQYFYRQTNWRYTVWVCFLRQDGQVFFLQCLERAEKQRYRWFRFCWQDI